MARPRGRLSNMIIDIVIPEKQEFICYNYDQNFYKAGFNERNIDSKTFQGVSCSSDIMYLRTRGRVFLDREERGYRCCVMGREIDEIFYLNAYGNTIKLAADGAVKVLQKGFAPYLKKRGKISITSTFREHNYEFDSTKDEAFVLLSKYGDVHLDYDTTYAGPGTYQNPYWIYSLGLSKDWFRLSASGTTISKAVMQLMSAMGVDWKEYYGVEYNFA